MRCKWYSDNRDLVKWSVLLQLADLHDATTILQVAYYRPTTWKGIEIDGQAYALPQAVINHFRNIKNITTLTSKVKVTVMDAPCHDRAEYLQCILRAIRNLPKEPAIVFLDPDTGLKPRGRAGLQHVLEAELWEIWHALRRGDLLALYQHETNKAGRPWIEDKQAQFEKAIGLKPGGSKLALGKNIARDVAFFFSQRLDPAETVQTTR